MWQWFITNGVWILIAVVAGLVLFSLLRRWVTRAMEKAVPKQWYEPLKATRRIVTWVIIGFGGVILALAGSRGCRLTLRCRCHASSGNSWRLAPRAWHPYFSHHPALIPSLHDNQGSNALHD